MLTEIQRIAGEYPHRDAVAEQGFEFRPAWWTSAISTDVFDELPVSRSKGESWRRIDRSNLFQIAATPGLEVETRPSPLAPTPELALLIQAVNQSVPVARTG